MGSTVALELERVDGIVVESVEPLCESETVRLRDDDQQFSDLDCEYCDPENQSVAFLKKGINYLL